MTDRVRAGFSGRLSVALWLCVLGAAIWLLLTRTVFVAELTAFLPKAETSGQALMLGQLSDGIASRLILIGIEGDRPERLVAMSRSVSATLRASGRFRYVANGEGDLSRAERDALFELRYHLSPTVSADRFTVAGLRGGLDRMLEYLGSPLGAIVRPLLPRDPTGEFLSLLETQSERARPPTRDGVWFDVGRERALLMAESATPGYDAKAQRELQQFVNATFAASAAGSAARLFMTGPSVFALKTQESIEHDAKRLTLVSVVLVALILAFAYQSLRLTGLALLPVISALILAIAAVGWVFGACHVITIGFGATLIGEAVDYPTYLFAQRRPDERVAATAARIGTTLRLAILTTVLGALAMLASSFVGIAQLGLFTLVGVGVAGWVTRYVLPVLAPHPALLPVRETGAAGGWLACVLVLRRIAWLVPTVLVVSSAYLALRHASVWERDLEKLSPIEDADKRADQQLRDALGAPDVRYLVVVRGTDANATLAKFESVHTTLEALRAAGAMVGFDSPAKYLPSAAMQRARLAALPAAAELERRLTQALDGLPFQDHIFNPFLADAARLRAATPIGSRDLEQTVWGLGLRSLLFESAGQWIGLAPLSVVREASQIARAVAALNDPAVSFFDLKTESDGMVAAHGWRSVVLGMIGLAAIAIVLWIGQRRVAVVARILLPVLAAIAATAAITVAMGTRLSFLHVVSLVMVLGTGVNYALFFANAPSAIEERNRTTLAVVIATVTTLVGFGVLVFADTPILRTIGLTVAIGAALSFVLSAAWASRPDQA